MCARWVSPKTGYKWLGRYQAQGAAGLAERVARAAAPRAGAAGEHARADPGLARALAVLGAAEAAGELAELRAGSGGAGRLAPSAICSGARAWCSRCGGAGAARPRRSPSWRSTAPNDVWCVDFKGWFRTGDGRRCDPLTVSDAYSRYLLRCQDVAAPTRPGCARCSRPPSASSACRRRSAPTTARRSPRPAPAGCPRWRSGGSSSASRRSASSRASRSRTAATSACTGRSRQATASPPAATLAAQQRAFDDFRREYNEERPHEALRPEAAGPRLRAVVAPVPAAIAQAGIRRG